MSDEILKDGKERGLTLAEGMSAARDRQASFRLEAEVRKAARAHDVQWKEIEGLVERARAAFVFVNGEPRVGVPKGKPELRNENGGLVTVEEWVALAAPATVAKAAGTFGPSPVPLPEKVKNPFKRGSWNLTEQMRIQRRDPELAARLKREVES